MPARTCRSGAGLLPPGVLGQGQPAPGISGRGILFDVARMYHVTSSRNRASIRENGLDWRLMSVSPGIAGSTAPEKEGCFLCRAEWEADWFVRMNNTGGPVDVWAVDDVDEDDLVRSPTGLLYLPATIPADRLTLLRTDIPPASDGRWSAEVPRDEQQDRPRGLGNATPRR
jgi:hypothetical protein